MASHFAATSPIVCLTDKISAFASDFKGTTHMLFLEQRDTPADLEPHNSLLQTRIEEVVTNATDVLLTHKMPFALVDACVKSALAFHDALAWSAIHYGMQNRLIEAGRMDFNTIKAQLDANPSLKREWEMAHSLVVNGPTVKEKRSRVHTKWAKRIEALRLESETTRAEVEEMEAQVESGARGLKY